MKRKYVLVMQLIPDDELDGVITSANTLSTHICADIQADKQEAARFLRRTAIAVLDGFQNAIRSNGNG